VDREIVARLVATEDASAVALRVAAIEFARHRGDDVEDDNDMDRRLMDAASHYAECRLSRKRRKL